MTAKAKIKVIKKIQIAPKTEATEPSVSEKKPKQAAREIVATVTNWVTEFQERRREESKQTLEKFLTPRPQTSAV